MIGQNTYPTIVRWRQLCAGVPCGSVAALVMLKSQSVLYPSKSNSVWSKLPRSNRQRKTGFSATVLPSKVQGWCEPALTTIRQGPMSNCCGWTHWLRPAQTSRDAPVGSLARQRLPKHPPQWWACPQQCPPSYRPWIDPSHCITQFVEPEFDVEAAIANRAKSSWGIGTVPRRRHDSRS